MFWKKKNKGDDTNAESKRIVAPQDSRQSYRVTPGEDLPITLFAGGNSYSVLDISSGGLSVLSEELKVGEDLDAEFTLPIELERISVKIKVLRRGKKDICHCRFLNISQDMEDKIHKYVLERQKEELRF